MKHNNQKGSALVYALVGTLAIATLSLVFLQRSQTEKRIAARYTAESEVNIALLEIGSQLLVSEDCTATFRTLTMPTATGPNSEIEVNALRECPNTSCSTGIITTFPIYKPVLNTANMAAIPVADRWKGSVTKFIQPGSDINAESNIRLVRATIRLVSVQPLSGYTNHVPGIVRLNLTFEARVGGGRTSTSPSVSALKTSKIIRTLDVPVVTNIFIHGNTRAFSPTTQGTVIQGCPKNPNSIVIK